MNNVLAQYSPLTIKITNQLDKCIKKKYGIFITPRMIIQQLIDRSLFYMKEQEVSIIQRILEPSCGTCEIVDYIHKIFEYATIDALEINKTIYENLSDFSNIAKIQNMNFMDFETTEPYDWIVTNPPYFVCSKEEVPIKYKKYVVGRPNMFGLFILHSLSMLKEGGILSFVIPKSFLNSGYYAEIRNYIKKTCMILEIIDFEKNNQFLDTEQSTKKGRKD